MLHEYCADYENVTLRPLNEGDIESLRGWRNDSANTRYLRKIPHITPRMQQDWFDRYKQNDDEICFAVVENRALKRVVGSLSLYEFSEDACLFGKILVGDSEAHGKGVGVNATRAALMIAFEQLGLNRVALFVYADNAKAIRVYREAGFAVADAHPDGDGKTEYTMVKYRED